MNGEQKIICVNRLLFLFWFLYSSIGQISSIHTWHDARLFVNVAKVFSLSTEGKNVSHAQCGIWSEESELETRERTGEKLESEGICLSKVTVLINAAL